MTSRDTEATDARSRRGVAWSAYAAAVLFALGLARFAFPAARVGDGTPAGLVVAAAPHVVLLLGVWPRLALPRWAAVCGLTWLVVDLTSDVLAVAGVRPEVFLGLRYLGHLSAAAWIVAIACHTNGVTRVVGVALAVLLGGYTLVSPWVPPIALAPTAPLLVLWWAAIGRRVAHGLLPVAAGWLVGGSG